jgi:hypothetical protein
MAWSRCCGADVVADGCFAHTQSIEMKREWNIEKMFSTASAVWQRQNSFIFAGTS